MTNTTVRVTKLGGGVEIPEGATIVVHLRSAGSPDDLDSDALVLRSTHGVRLRVDREVLRQEVFAALVGLAVGSTVVIPIVADEDAAAGIIFVEVWIADIQGVDTPERLILTAVSTGLAPKIVNEMRRAIANSTTQNNGHVIGLAVYAESTFLDVVSRIRADSQQPAPHQIGTPGDYVTYLVAAPIYGALKQQFE